MGRRAVGPVRLNGGQTWYARLTVKPRDRQLVGKTRLIRSLQTTDHSLALKRYGQMMVALERELKQLLSGSALREQVEIARNTSYWIEEEGLVPMDATDIALVHGWDTNSDVTEALNTGKPLPITWDELLELYINVKNRSNSRELAPRTLNAVKLAISRVRDICGPTGLDKIVVRRLINTMEQTLSSSTVKQQLSLLSSLVQVGIKNDVIDIVNPFPLVEYSVGKGITKRRAFTDKELLSINGPLLWLVMTGMRPAELATRTVKDIDNGMVIIRPTDNGWRPKTLNSYRRVPMPEEMVLPTREVNANGAAQKWRNELRAIIDDKTVTPHSGRHTFVELGRRAGVQPLVLEALIGHGNSVGSQSTRGYGSFTDDVLKQEAVKVWTLIRELKQHCRPM